jgi:hypothetical protein
LDDLPLSGLQGKRVREGLGEGVTYFPRLSVILFSFRESGVGTTFIKEEQLQPLSRILYLALLLVLCYQTASFQRWVSDK